MTPPVLLTPPTPGPIDTDCAAKRNLAPFGVKVLAPGRPLAGPSTSTSTSTPFTGITSTSLVMECDEGAPTRPPHARHGQWTGAPIRAIVPLPRRKLAAVALGAGAITPQQQPQPYVMCVPHFLDEDDEDEDGDGDGDCEGDEDEVVVAEEQGSRSRYCSYESISASEGLSAWSFEELRVECYAQSIIARGTKPPPVVQHSLAIPPAFVPRLVPQS